MKNIMFGLVAAASLVFGTGCGGSTCEKARDAFESLDEKSEACFPSDEDDEEITDADVEQCEEALEKCSDDDIEKIESAMDCLEDLDECKSGGEQAFSLQAFACLAKATDLSAGCSFTISVEE
ncbi:hypothetical protein ACLESO_53155 [Pyxidicoccus sp. 3LG]